MCIRGSIRFLGLGLIEINCHWEFTSCKLILNKVAKFCCVTDDVVRHCLVVIRAGPDWLLLSMYACGNMFCLRFCDHYSGKKKLLPRWTVYSPLFSRILIQSLNARRESRENWTPAQNGRLYTVGVRGFFARLSTFTFPPPHPPASSSSSHCARFFFPVGWVTERQWTVSFLVTPEVEYQAFPRKRVG